MSFSSSSTLIAYSEGCTVIFFIRKMLVINPDHNYKSEQIPLFGGDILKSKRKKKAESVCYKVTLHISLFKKIKGTHQSLHTQEQHIHKYPSLVLKHGFGLPLAHPLQGQSLKVLH